MNQSTLLIKSRRKTKQIVSMEVTKEDVADRNMLKPLVHHMTTLQHPFDTEQRIGYRQ